jgi:hypothetical protein
MASAAASGVVGAVTYTAAQKGEGGNLINVAVSAAAADTGAVVVADSGNQVTVVLATTTGAITSTISGVKAAVNAGSRLVVASGGTDGNTGVAGTGTLASGTSGAAGYDDLAGATGDGWILTNVAAPVGTNAHVGIDEMVKVASTGPGTGRRIRVAAEAATGATTVSRKAYDEELRRAKMGYPRSLRKIGETGAHEYLYG